MQAMQMMDINKFRRWASFVNNLFSKKRLREMLPPTSCFRAKASTGSFALELSFHKSMNESLFVFMQTGKILVPDKITTVVDLVTSRSRSLGKHQSDLEKSTN